MNTQEQDQEEFLKTFAARRDVLLGEIKILEDTKVVLLDDNKSLTESNSQLTSDIAANTEIRKNLMDGHAVVAKNLFEDISQKKSESSALASQLSVLTTAIEKASALIDTLSKESASIFDYSKQTKETVLSLVEGIKENHIDAVGHVANLSDTVQQFKNTVAGSVTEIINERERVHDAHRQNAEWSATLNERENSIRADEERAKLKAGQS